MMNVAKVILITYVLLRSCNKEELPRPLPRSEEETIGRKDSLEMRNETLFPPDESNLFTEVKWKEIYGWTTSLLEVPKEKVDWSTPSPVPVMNSNTPFKEGKATDPGALAVTWPDKSLATWVTVAMLAMAAMDIRIYKYLHIEILFFITTITFIT